MKFRLLFVFVFLIFPLSVSFAEGENIIQTSIKNKKFVPDEIHIIANQSVTLRIINEDAIPVEFESMDLNKEKLVPPGKTIDIPLKGLKPGIYEFFSDFGPKDLRGKIIVE
jgi:hypothetical protein